jgi:apolipoprotein N-acyltransferase
MGAGAEVLLVPTNASSFSTTQMPALELGAARMRAVETGRWVVQSAPTGFSAVIDPAGHVHRATRLGEAALLPAAVDLRDGRTPYTALGDGPVVALAMLTLAGSWGLALRRDRPAPAPVRRRPAGSSVPR